jgi:SAM-dependent methyltransferase
MSDELDRLLAEQMRYYEARAAEYEDLWFRRDPHDRGQAFNENWFRETAIIEAAADAFDASGRVLELACGTGLWTRRLAPRATQLVAVDSSPAMIELNSGRYGTPTVTYVQADLFEWEPERALRRGLHRVLRVAYPARPMVDVLGEVGIVARAGRSGVHRGRCRRTGEALLGRSRGSRAGVRASASAG